MLSYQFNEKTVFVSEQETDNLKHRLAAKAQYDVLTDRERRIALEMARRIAISACSAKLIRGASKVYDAKLKEIMSTPLSPEEFQQLCVAAAAERDAEIARIEAAKVA